jgi:hypothetical protein
MFHARARHGRDVDPNIWQTTRPMTKQSTATRTSLYFLLACLLAVIVYYPGLSGDYAFDDIHNLVTNPRLEMRELNLDTLQTASFSSGAGKLKRPVSMFTFALNRYFFGVNPWSYKVINLSIHLLTGLALYWLARLLVTSHRRLNDPSLPAAAEVWLPLAVCALWLVHPLNLTGVLYVVQRMTSLAALFTVLGLCFYLVGRRRLLEGRSGWPWIFGGLLGLGSLAVLSKENGILLPGYMLVIEMALFRFRGPDGRMDRGVATFFGVFLLLPALLVVVLLMQSGYLLDGYSGRDFTLTERVMTQARVLLFYLKQVLAPSVSELGLYHDDIAISRGLLDPPATLYAVMAVTGLLALGFALLGKMPLAGLGILWFFCGHALESTILPLEIAHEHRNYLADFGIILALGAAAAKLPGGRLASLIKIAAPALFIILLSYTTWIRSSQWSDNVTQAVYEVIHHPQSPRSAFAAGRIHARLALTGHTESTGKAYHYLERASELDYSGILPDVIMIQLAFLLERPVKHEWYERIITKLKHYPIKAADLNGLHVLSRCQQNACNTPRATMEAIYDTVLNHESLRNAGNREAHAYTSYGFYLINVHGEFRQGLEYFYRAVEAKPETVQHWINLIKVLVAMQRAEEAEQQLELFRSSDIPGATRRDFNRLTGMIEDIRLTSSQAEQGEPHPVENGE